MNAPRPTARKTASFPGLRLMAIVGDAPLARAGSTTTVSKDLFASGDLIADCRYAYGRAAAGDGDFLAAADVFEQALERAPDWAPALFALGEARERLGRREAAAKAFRRTLAADPPDAWAGHHKEVKEAAAELEKVYPGFTVQKWAGIHWTEDPTFNAQFARIVEGRRKAGVPEGEKKTN